MDHAAAHERLADLALEPGALADVAAGAPGHADLAAHLAGCAACRTELTALLGLQSGLDDALASATLKGFGATATLKGFEADALDRLEPPAALRSTVLAAARRPAPRALPPFARVAVAAALVLAVGAVGFLIGSSRAPSTADAGHAAVVAALDRILTTPAADRWVVTLTDASGAAAGSVSWSTRDFVVLTSALAPAPAGKVYRCWLETAAGTSAIGAMDLDGAMAYWVGTADEWAGIEIRPGSKMIVTLEAAGAPGAAPTSPAILTAEL
jgi:hypothetical protein